jgi:hypothetical protein
MAETTNDFIPQDRDTPDKPVSSAVTPAPTAPKMKAGANANDDTSFIPQDRDTPDKQVSAKPSMGSRADTAITETLAPNPKNYQSIARTNFIEVPKTLGREVYSMGKTAMGMPGGIYHSIVDPATEEEKAAEAPFEKEHGEAPGTETSGAKRVGLAVGRLSGIDSAGEAIKTYANPGTRPTVDQALRVLPEAMGQGAGTVVGGKLIGYTAEKVPAVAQGAVDATRGAIDAIKEAAQEGGKNALPKIKSIAERASTPKNLATAATTAVAPGYGHAMGPVAGKLVEIALGKERANTPLFKTGEPLDATQSNQPYAGETEPAATPQKWTLPKLIKAPEYGPEQPAVESTVKGRPEDWYEGKPSTKGSQALGDIPYRGEPEGAQALSSVPVSNTPVESVAPREGMGKTPAPATTEGAPIKPIDNLNTSKQGAPVAEAAPDEAEVPSMARLQAYGNAPRVTPGVKISEQNTAPAAEAESLGQFVRANGPDVDAAISKEFKEPNAAQAARETLHSVKNVELGNLAIKEGAIPEGTSVSRSKTSGGVTRAEAFQALMSKMGGSVENVVKALAKRTEGEAGKPGSVGESFSKQTGTLKQGQKGSTTDIPITRGIQGLEGVDKFIDDLVKSTDAKQAGSNQSASVAGGKGLAVEKSPSQQSLGKEFIAKPVTDGMRWFPDNAELQDKSDATPEQKFRNAAGRLAKASIQHSDNPTPETLSALEVQLKQFENATKDSGITKAGTASGEGLRTELPSFFHHMRDALLSRGARANQISSVPRYTWMERFFKDAAARDRGPAKAISSTTPKPRAGEATTGARQSMNPLTDREPSTSAQNPKPITKSQKLSRLQDALKARVQRVNARAERAKAKE